MTLLESQAALPNASVRFKGTFKGTPPFTVKWFQDDTEVMTGPACFTGLEGLSCFLELYSVGVSQSGLYSCQVSNDAGSARSSADLVVKGWILFCYISLSCFAHSSSSYFWAEIEIVVTVVFRPAARPDSLLVCCSSGPANLDLLPVVTTNHVLRASASLTCVCFGFPEPPEFVLKLPATKLVKQGAPLRLECRVRGSAPLRVTWYKQDTAVSEEGHCRTSFVDSVAVLELLSTSFDDEGVYTCDVHNDAGSVSCSTTLAVKGQFPADCHRF